MTALRLENVGISFGATEVLRKVSLHVEPGEFVSILGPSGAGKSTLFGLLTREVTPDHGTIHVDGIPLSRQSRTFAFMPQRDALLPWLRVLDNVTIGLEVQCIARAAARAKSPSVVRRFRACRI